MAIKDEPIATVTQYNLGFLLYIISIPSLHQITDAQVSNFSRDTLIYNMVGGRKPLREVCKTAFTF